MAEIDTEALIQAVKKRPALYNKNDHNYFSHKKHKAKLWTEVCKEVFANWDEFKPQNKVESGHELQRRWKSLRTCFSRELGLQKKEKLKTVNLEGPVRKKRKRYEYFNMMSFLLEPGEENDLTVDTEDDSSDPLDTVKHEPLAYETSDVGNPIRCDMEPEMGILRPFERNENLEDKILDMLKDIKKDEEDEDRQFMLSLVPSFRKLQDKQKFEARIEILRVLKDITFRDESK